ncbi:YkvA family protein [Azotobacter armeniacus]
MTTRLIYTAKQWARTIKRDVHAVWLAARDPRTPWLAKVLALAVAAYAVSPIDLIPDFIPVLGYLDDLVIVPLGILLVVRLIPPQLMAEHREVAAKATERPVSRFAAGLIIALWIACAVLLARAFL